MNREEFCGMDNNFELLYYLLSNLEHISELNVKFNSYENELDIYVRWKKPVERITFSIEI